MKSIHPENKVLIKDDKEGPGGLSGSGLETESGRVESGEGRSDRGKEMFVFNTAYTLRRLDPFRMSPVVLRLDFNMALAAMKQCDGVVHFSE